MQVLKFGGTSLGNAHRILEVLLIIQERCTQSRLGVVLSAVSGVTDLLLTSITKVLADEDVEISVSKFFTLHNTIIDELTHKNPEFPSKKIRDSLEEICNKYRTFLQEIQLIKECPVKAYCQILSLGERMSAHIMEVLLMQIGIHIKFINSCDFIKTKRFLKESTPIIQEIESRFSAVMEQSFTVLLMSGFVGSDMEGNLSLLGRNGSDYSASIMAVGVKAERCEIWTDVDGFYTVDPTQILDTKLIPVMSYGEAMELAYYGAKVLHHKTTRILMDYLIPLYIKNTFFPSHE
ncbi:Bifunctional aspartokinase/homoserine dehydrogenase N-terminal domain protein (plasmid) [Candidatus Trichorickettsia mobilis]|uniref:aspartate kinase n=1 Tax=Candidatus Trichorickettsia mobilis TaxID=1346319 RepID=UPI002B256630|nr:aspartate kinase [Candidatus Trichorickettsia mobilis]WPY01831.1 Bifunctional aspartokinase/homoserine dehydrogenase N-terminal domain protein [Candidatus Trichorickettsia mobilis]